MHFMPCQGRSIITCFVLQVQILWHGRVCGLKGPGVLPNHGCIGCAAQVVFAISYFALPPEFTGIFEDSERVVKNWHLFFCVACGLWGGLIIGIATEYFTSNRYQPVRVRLCHISHLARCTGRDCVQG